MIFEFYLCDCSGRFTRRKRIEASDVSLAFTKKGISQLRLSNIQRHFREHLKHEILSRMESNLDDVLQMI